MADGLATPLLLVGCGKMGSALLDGWLDQGLDPGAVHVVEPAAEARAALATKGVTVHADPGELPPDLVPAVAVLAVKPQVMADVLAPYARFAGAETVFLSIAAGKPLSFFAHHLGAAAVVVRAMPNTPAAVRRGITVACAGPGVGPGQRDACTRLLKSVGAVAWVDDESHMDAVTAVSGSGPAYVFWLVECLARAGAAAGLPEDLAARLARATVAGSGALLDTAPEDAGTLRRNVTSPGGTTAAALEVLMADDALAPLLETAVAAATRRSRELAG